MKWHERLYRTKARKYLLIGILAAFLPIGTAVTIGGMADSAIDEVITESE